MSQGIGFGGFKGYGGSWEVFIGLQEQDHCCAGKGCPRAVSSLPRCLLKRQNKDKSIRGCLGKGFTARFENRDFHK